MATAKIIGRRLQWYDDRQKTLPEDHPGRKRFHQNGENPIARHRAAGVARHAPAIAVAGTRASCRHSVQHTAHPGGAASDFIHPDLTGAAS